MAEVRLNECRDAALIALRARLSGGGAPEAALQAASEPAPVLETRTEPQAVPEPPPAQTPFFWHI